MQAQSATPWLGPPNRCAVFRRVLQALYIGQVMNQKIDELIRHMSSVEYPRWRNRASSAFLAVLCTGMVGCYWYLHTIKPSLKCYDGYLFFSVVWLLSEYVLIIYLYRYNNIPRFARTNIKMVIVFSNMWFGLFLFSLQPCAV